MVMSPIYRTRSFIDLDLRNFSQVLTFNWAANSESSRQRPKSVVLHGLNYRSAQTSGHTPLSLSITLSLSWFDRHNDLCILIFCHQTTSKAYYQCDGELFCTIMHHCLIVFEDGLPRAGKFLFFLSFCLTFFNESTGKDYPPPVFDMHALILQRNAHNGPIFNDYY